MNTRFWSPLYLGDSIGPMNNIGDDLTVNPRSLLNPNRGPMLIDQFRFSAEAAYGQLDLFYLWQAMAIFGVEIRLGAVPLMSQPVTLGAFAPRYAGVGGFAYDDLISTPVPRADTILVWHLAKPLFVPQDVQVSVRMVRQRLYALGSTQSALEPNLSFEKLRVSIAGRSLPQDTPTPEQIWVPWVTETKAQVAGSQFVSKDSDLINNHDTPLHVRALCGVNTHAYRALLNTAADLRVQMTASNGTMIIRDPTPFPLLFPSDRGLLEVDALLQPGEFFRARLEVVDLPNGAAARDADVQFTAIGMTGYRQVRTPKPNR